MRGIALFPQIRPDNSGTPKPIRNCHLEVCFFRVFHLPVTHFRSSTRQVLIYSSFPPSSRLRPETPLFSRSRLAKCRIPRSVLYNIEFSAPDGFMLTISSGVLSLLRSIKVTFTTPEAWMPSSTGGEVFKILST